MFLETLYAAANFTRDEVLVEGLAGGAIVAALFAIFISMIFIWIAIYVYMGFAYQSIAKKVKIKSPGLAWIPCIGPLIIAYKASNMKSWPWWLLASIILMPIPILGIVIVMIALFIFYIYSVIWHWKMFKKVGKPGWWAILSIISPLNLIFIGIAAWSKK